MSHEDSQLGRRRFVLGSAAALLGATACGKKMQAAEFTCTDVGGLSDADQAARVNAGYSDRSTDPKRSCSECHQFLSGGGGCGACKLFRGPVHPKGTCRVFGAKG